MNDGPLGLRLRRTGRVLPPTVLAAAAWLSFLSASAAPSSKVATRPMTLQLTASGKATWTGDTPTDVGRLTMSYSWRGTLRFRVPLSVLANPSSARVALTSEKATLTGSWTATLAGRTESGFTPGPYRCRYTGRGAKTPVRGLLVKSRRRGMLELVLNSRNRIFFNPRGPGSAIDCTTRTGDQGPTHFDPGWLFRDTVTDHGRLTSDIAVITVPRDVLVRRLMRVTFPREQGVSRGPLRGETVWNNRGRVGIRRR